MLDANLSPRVAVSLRDAGFDVVHVADLGLTTASDEMIFDRAVHDGLVVTPDSDFGTVLEMRRSKSPSVAHLRGVAESTFDVHAGLLEANLSKMADDLEGGAIVSLSPNRLAVRQLPIR